MNSAAAEDHDGGTTVEVPGTGVAVGVYAHGVSIRTPDTPLAPQPVRSPLENQSIHNDPVRSFNPCLSDDEFVAADAIDCEVEGTVDPLSPCEDARRTVGETPIVGGTVGDQYDGGLTTADDAFDDPAIAETLSAFGVKGYDWGDRASRLGQGCETDTPGTTVEGGDSGVLYTVGHDGYRVCPFGDGGVVCADEGPSTIGDERDKAGESIPTEGCSFDRGRGHCGTVDTPLGPVDPLAPTHTLLNESVVDEPITTGPIHATNASTPRLPGVYWEAPLATAFACTTPGYSSYENATSTLSIVPQVGLSYNGDPLPFGLEGNVGVVFATVTSASSTAAGAATNAWAEHTPGAVTATEAAWLTAVNTAGLEPGEGDVDDGSCEAEPGAPPQVEDPDGVLTPTAGTPEA